MREQPLIVGAVGLTIGAIIGASLPRSRKEDEVMGEASDSFKAAHSKQRSANGQICARKKNLLRVSLVAEYLSGRESEFVLDPLDIGIGQNREVGAFWEDTA